VDEGGARATQAPGPWTPMAETVSRRRRAPRPLMAPARSTALVESKTRKLLAAFADPAYRGPVPESPALVAAFIEETVPHVHRVMGLTQRMGAGAQARTHDLVELVPLERVERLVARLAKSPDLDVSWLAALVKAARENPRNAARQVLDVGKLRPQVAAGLARSGKPDLVALELHRLSDHHHQLGTRTEIVEGAADIIDALVSPRSYKEGMSYEAAEAVFWDGVAHGRIALADTSENRQIVREVVAMHKDLAETLWK
jgi:hypothetical protein